MEYSPIDRGGSGCRDSILTSGGAVHPSILLGRVCESPESQKYIMLIHNPQLDTTRETTTARARGLRIYLEPHFFRHNSPWSMNFPLKLQPGLGSPLFGPSFLFRASGGVSTARPAGSLDPPRSLVPSATKTSRSFARASGPADFSAALNVSHQASHVPESQMSK